MIHEGDLFDVLLTLAAERFDSCVTDPPYGIGFMGKEWDTFAPSNVQQAWDLRQRAEFKNGVVSANIKGRKRTPAVSPSQIQYNRSLEGQRGFQEWTMRWALEVYRVLKPGAHLVVCGAPRSHHRMMCGLEDAGFEIRDCLAWLFGQGFPKSRNLGAGWGTALKPGHEPIALARKPFKGTTTANHQAYGVGGLNVKACLIGTSIGRWPANVLLDEDAAQLLDEQSGELVSGTAVGGLHRMSDTGLRRTYGTFKGNPEAGDVCYGDTGGASRFFYVAKPSREERDLGCDGLPTGSNDFQRPSSGLSKGRGERMGGPPTPHTPLRNVHPTVKPLALMRWLVRLVTPANGVVLDPFGGSGTTAMACAAEGLDFVLIEREAAYVPIIHARVRSIAPLFTDGAAG